MSEGKSEASAAKKRKLGQLFRPEYCIEFSCLMKSTQNIMLIANIANKTCPFSTVVGMNTHIQQKVEKCQVNSISGTPELDINYSMGG